MVVDDDEDASLWHPSQGKPKKRLHAYLIYVKERKNDMMKDQPNLTFKEMMQFVSKCWKELPPEERAYFDQKAEVDRERHDRQVREYNTWCAQNPGQTSPIKQKKPSASKYIPVTSPHYRPQQRV